MVDNLDRFMKGKAEGLKETLIVLHESNFLLGVPKEKSLEKLGLSPEIIDSVLQEVREHIHRKDYVDWLVSTKEEGFIEGFVETFTSKQLLEGESVTEEMRTNAENEAFRCIKDEGYREKWKQEAEKYYDEME